MKTAIIGKQGVGKTMLIVKETVPTIEKYLVFDFCDEYSHWIDDKTKIKKFKKGLVGKQLKEQVVNIIRSIDNDTVLIIDNTHLLNYPILKSDGIKGRLRGGFLWLEKELSNKKYIMVFQSLQLIIDGEITSVFNDIYYFPTRDNDDVRKGFFTYRFGNANIIFKSKFNRNFKGNY